MVSGGIRCHSAVPLFPEASEFFSTEIVQNQTQNEHFDYNKIINQNYTTLFTDIHTNTFLRELCLFSIFYLKNLISSFFFLLHFSELFVGSSALPLQHSYTESLHARTHAYAILQQNCFVFKIVHRKVYYDINF